MSSGGDGVVIAWDVGSGTIVKKFKNKSGNTTHTKFSPCGGFIATALGQPFISIWAIGSWDIVQTLHGGGYIGTLAYSGELIAGQCGDRGSSLTLWCVSTGEVRNTLRGHSEWILSIVF